MKKKLTASLLILILIIPGVGSAQNMFEKMNCCELSIFGTFVFFASLFEDFDNSRTTTVKINGGNARFKSNSVVKNDNIRGAILSGELLEPVETTVLGQKIFIEPGEIEFHENGKIKSCRISGAELLTAGGKPVPCLDHVEFHDSGYLKKAYITTYDDYDMDYSSSKNRRFVYSIQGIDRSLNGEIIFNPEGKIEQCRNAADSDYSIANYMVRIPRGTTLVLSAQEKIRLIKTGYDKRISIKFREKFISLTGEISLHDNGKIGKCSFDESMVIHNGRNKLRVRNAITFYENEMIESCFITNPVQLVINSNTIEFDRESESPLQFHRNGNLKSGRLTYNKKQYYTHRGNRFRLKDGWNISFYEDGSLQSLTPADGTVIKIKGTDLYLDDYEIVFYQNGNVLSVHIENGSEFVYKGSLLTMETYVGQLFFDQEQEVIAFTNDQARLMRLGGKDVTIPQLYEVGYNNYETRDISFVQVYGDNMVLPPNVKYVYDEYSSSAVIFVKAGRLSTNEGKTELIAHDIKEIMFSEDTVIFINGKEQLCRAMKWVPLQ